VQPRGVLVVDDEAPVRSLLDTALRQEGFTVWQAASGDEALELYRRHRGEIGLVFLDIRMPGLDGVQTLMGMQAIAPNVQCCFMTGQTGGHSYEQLIELGAARVFEKPFRVAEVLQVARQLVTPVSR